MEKVKSLLKANPDLVFSKDNIGFTPLHIAAATEQMVMAELLISNNADVNAKDNSGLTPLFHAAATEQLRCYAFTYGCS